MNLNELIADRMDWVRISQKNRFDFDSILAGLYNDPSHFIYEILQNAEDASASKVRFELYEDRLDITHNGNDFNLEDINGVTGIGISTKKSDLTAIGKFGVGFKSVFAITETPHIYSGAYRIKIEDFVVPVELIANERAEMTLIRLPFNHKFRSQHDIYDLVNRKLENIGLTTLLFLRNVNEIRWSSPHGDGHYLKEIADLGGAKKVTAISESSSEEYIIIEKPVNFAGKTLKVEVAYKLGKDKQDREIVVQEPDSKLVVYFPTEKVTYLNFLVQGPYKTTPNRENIPLDDEQNKMIIDETSKLLAESLPIIKRLGYLDTNFLNLMPIHPKHKEKDPIYAALYNKTKEKFLSNEDLLPTAIDGIYTSHDAALLARGKDLIDFLSNEDIYQLFSKRHWLDTNITYDKTRELRDYLINELDIKEVDFEDFAKSLTRDFLQTKSDDWMVEFYSRLLGQEALWRDRDYRSGLLRTKPFIRLDNGEHVAPFDKDGKAQVYLPSETRSEYRTVKRNLIENEDVLTFFKELGLTTPDRFAEVKELILPKYQAVVKDIDDIYYEDFAKILIAYETVPSDKKKDYVLQLKDTPFINSMNHAKHEIILRPIDVYFGESDLREYFFDNSDIYFVSDNLINKFGVERLTPFLLEVGVASSPRRIKIESDLSRQDKIHLIGDAGYTRDIDLIDFTLEGLDNILSKMTSGKSTLVWSLLLSGIINLDRLQIRHYFNGEYKWFYRTDHSVYFDAHFLKLLKKAKWLVNRSGDLCKPSDLTPSELGEDYAKDSRNIEILIKELQFKPDVIDQLPPEDRKKFELTKNYTPEELEKVITEYEKKSNDKQGSVRSDLNKPWEPTCKPDEVMSEIEVATTAGRVVSGLEGQAAALRPENFPDQTPAADRSNEKDDSETEGMSVSDKKAIGAWGESLVYNALKNEYIQKGMDVISTEIGFMVNNYDVEIVWLNVSNNVGKGYDFVKKEKGDAAEYIEVKSKLRSEEELIEITGTQWEFARSLYNKGEGKKYSIYVVSNAGQQSAKITKLNDPISLWKENKLYAHPINFKL